MRHYLSWDRLLTPCLLYSLLARLQAALIMCLCHHHFLVLWNVLHWLWPQSVCERVYVFVCLCEHEQLWKWRCLLWPVLGLQPWLAGRGGSQDTERYCVVLTAFQPAGSQEQCQIKANRGKKLTISQRTATVSYKFKADMNIMIRTRLCIPGCFLCLGRNINIVLAQYFSPRMSVYPVFVHGWNARVIQHE
jgi:hypothetical protein